MTSAFCLFVFETFVSRLLALFGTIITSESGNPTPPGDKWERKLLVFGIFYSFLTSGRPLSSSTDLRLAHWTCSMLWNGNPNYGFWSWHKATCYFRGLWETASSTASFGRTSPRGRILTNTSKFVKVIASVECDLGILAILTGAWMLLSLTSFIFGLKRCVSAFSCGCSKALLGQWGRNR